MSRIVSATTQYFLSPSETEDHKLTAIQTEKHQELPAKSSILQRWIIRRFYVISWIRLYSKDIAVADLIAGVTLGLTIIPQSIAYAALAGLPAEYGLYSAFIGSLVYAIFGSIPQVSVGPTSLMAILTLQYTADLPNQFAVILAFLAGVVELLMGLLKLGFLVNFISVPVTSSFTTATSVIIIVAQLKTLLGIKKSKAAFAGLDIFRALRLGDTILGLGCIAVLIGLRQIGNLKCKKQTPRSKTIEKLLWYISISRNALVVCITAALSYYWIHLTSRADIPYFLTNNVQSTSIAFNLPPFNINNGNTTYNIFDICNELGSGIIVLPLVAVLANVAIAKAFVKDGGLDASQEMLTLGMCNIAGSFVNAMPTCGAFTRSAVSQASGVKTPISGIYSAAMVLLSIGLLTPYFQYIPKSALSAVLISAVLFMVDFKLVAQLWTCNKKDFLSWMMCFVVSVLFGVQTGLLLGVGIDIFYILLNLGTPKINAEVKIEDGVKFIYIAPASYLFYSGLETLNMEIKKICKFCDYELPVVINCAGLLHFDYTTKHVLQTLGKELEQKNVVLILQSLNNKIEKHFLKCKNIVCKSDDSTLSGLLSNKQMSA